LKPGLKSTSACCEKRAPPAASVSSIVNEAIGATTVREWLLVRRPHATIFGRLLCPTAILAAAQTCPAPPIPLALPIPSCPNPRPHWAV
jgi:hypothetical protein